MSDVDSPGLTLTASRRIRRISVATVLVLAVSAAVLSFSGLRLLALEAGYPPMLAWMFPVVVDGLVLAGSLGVISAALARVRTTYFWFLTLLGVFISIVGNIASAPEDLLSQAVHAAPPLIFALSVEGLLKVYRHAAIRQTGTSDAAEAPQENGGEAPLVTPSAGTSLALAEAPMLSSDQRSHTSGPTPPPTRTLSPMSPVSTPERATHGATQGTARERLELLIAEEPDISGAAAARALNIDPSHARRLLREMRSTNHAAD